MIVTEKICGLCREAEVIRFRGVAFCPLCDNPPAGEALWFVYWCYREEEDP